jgi:hypothetical protein
MAGSADEHTHHENHGNSIAAWTAVVIITLAFVIGAFAVMSATVWLFWASVGLCAVGVVAGKVLALMGFGVHVDEPSSADAS